MDRTRAATSTRIVRGIAFLWLLLVPIGQIIRLPYLRGQWREPTWLFSSGALVWVWVATTIWSGSCRLGYRGMGRRTVDRSKTPAAFWRHVGFAIAIALALVAIGILHWPASR